MPQITEQELDTYQEGLKEVERLKESNRNLNDASKRSNKSKKAAIFICVLALLGVGYFAYSSSNAKKDITISSNENIKTINNQEVFAVQVGAFEKKDLSLYSENFVNFKEIKEGSFNKYALGNFESLDEAKLFREELVNLGLTDAFIGVYLNGERVRIEKVF